MLRSLFTFLLISTKALAFEPVPLIQDFTSMVNGQRVGMLKEQAFCYETELKTVEGYQPDKLQRIASLSKLFTTLLAAETADLRKTFKTKVYIGRESLHIEGGRDPYFEEEKLLLLFQALNDLGYQRFKRISFSTDFKFWDVALESFKLVTPADTRARLLHYLNPKSEPAVRTIWQGILKFAAEENVTIDRTFPTLRADSVVISDANPLLGENPKIYIHESKPFHKILKAMNVMSKNTVSQNVYDDASRALPFERLASENQIPAASYRIYNGSGLPMSSRAGRLDNLATCRTVLRVIDLLTRSLEKQRLRASDLLAVSGGKDLGTFRERFEEETDAHDALAAKTGTIRNASAIAGLIFVDGRIPFAILNHSTNIELARRFQDQFIGRMFHHLGRPAPLSYEKIPVFPWVNKPFLEASED